MAERLNITAQIEDGQTVTLTGRNAWTLLQLIDAGPKGCTPIERPAPSWSDYVFQLRGMGFDIETLPSSMADHFPAHMAATCFAAKLSSWKRRASRHDYKSTRS